FNTESNITTNGCWNTATICSQDAWVWNGNGNSFFAYGQSITCSGAQTCVSHVGINTYNAAWACQGTWDVYCDNVLVGSINTVAKGFCAGSAMTNGCNVT